MTWVHRVIYQWALRMVFTHTKNKKQDKDQEVYKQAYLIKVDQNQDHHQKLAQMAA